MRTVVVVGAAFALAGTAQAQTFYSGQNGSFQATDTAFFDDTVLGGGGTTNTQPGIDTHGMNFSSVHVNEAGGFWGYSFPGGDGTASCYFNGGQSDVMRIVRLDGLDFDTVEMQLGDGYGQGNGLWAWITVWNNGGQVASFDYDGADGDYVGITGGGFDEIRYQAYFDAAARDAHNELSFGAGAVDNVSYGVIPAPGALALLAMGGMTASRRRRR